MRSTHDGFGVFVVDDHEMVRRGLRSLFDDTGDLRVVGEAADVATALQTIPRVDPDVLVIDYRLPDGRGLEVVQGLDRPHAETPWVMLTAFEPDEETMFSAVRLGAAAVVVKRARARELVEVVCRAAQGENLVDPDLRARAVAHAQRAPADDVLSGLTRRERQVLDLIGEGLSNREVAERLGLTEKTVKNHVTGLLSELGLSRRTQAAALITRHRSGSLDPV